MRLLAVVGLTIPCWPPMSDAGRARRDTDKVFSFIKFQTVRIKPAGEPANKPPRPTSPAPARPVHLPRATEAPAAAAVAFPAEAEPETDDRDDHEDVALQMQNFVAPVLTPAVQATLGAGARNVKVRFTVEASGQVSKAEAAADVPRRLAKPATDAILQWRFAPLPQARTTEVEIAFRRD